MPTSTTHWPGSASNWRRAVAQPSPPEPTPPSPNPPAPFPPREGGDPASPLPSPPRCVGGGGGGGRLPSPAAPGGARQQREPLSADPSSGPGVGAAPPPSPLEGEGSGMRVDKGEPKNLEVEPLPSPYEGEGAGVGASPLPQRGREGWEKGLLILIVLLGLGLRLWGIGWSLPDVRHPLATYHPDELVNLNAARAADIP